MNAALNTAPRSLTFAMEDGETANGIDDDGDGLIDEGAVRLVHDNSTVAMISGVEDCGFCFDGRMLGIRLRVARRDGQGRTFRGYQEQWYYLRNN